MNHSQDFSSMFAGQPPPYQSAPNAAPTLSNQQQDLMNGAAGSPVPAPPRPAPEVNAATLCRIGQETVHDILIRTNEIFQALKILQPPTGTVSGAAAAKERKMKIIEQLRTLSVLLRRLRMVYDKCCELTKNLDMSYMHVESLIPLKDELDSKNEEKKNTESYRQAETERALLREQVATVNQEIKEAIDLQRRTVWEINTMLAMRRT